MVRWILGSSAATAFLSPEVLERPNLRVAVGVSAEKILTVVMTNSKRSRAYGVQLSKGRNEPSYVVHADKEVIVCAGAFGTPQILQISGIGPRDVLEKVGIPLVADLPAGKNLYEVSFPSSPA
jgi:choline dehydrogenase